MTRAETAMIPVSRREIAAATAALAIARQRVEVEALELVLGGDDTSALGEQRDEHRQQSVDVVEAVGGLAAREQSSAPRATWTTTATWAKRRTYQKPTDGRAQYQAAPPQTPAARLATSTATPATRWTVEHRGRIDSREIVA